MRIMEYAILSLETELSREEIFLMRMRLVLDPSEPRDDIDSFSGASFLRLSSLF